MRDAVKKPEKSDGDRPPYLWDEEMIELAEKVGNFIRERERDEERKYRENKE